MTEMPLVSVIIPVYNVEDYIEACVTSVQKQTLKDIEIILVDDGSPDRSGEICDRLASEDNRIKVIHKENGGLSDARNVGVSQARADLIGFVDSDDTIEPTMYEVLYDSLTRENADISFCGIWNIYPNFKASINDLTEGYFVYSKLEVLKKVLASDNATMHSVTKLYKKNLLSETPFPVGKTYEDAHFIIGYLLKCEKAVFDLQPLYNYYRREGSITMTPYKVSDLSIIEAHENNYKLLEKFIELRNEASYRRYWSHFFVLDKILKLDKPHTITEKKIIINFLRINFINIIKNQYIGRGRKLALVGLMVHEKIYHLILYIYLNIAKKLVKR
jgi:glycosyltransferase involved in cell wall biosynthesis